jgi:peroxiredoxin
MYAYEELVSVGRRLHVGHVLSARELVGVRGEVVSLPSEGELVHLQLRRFAGCPVCNLHLRSFAMRRDEIAAAGIREVIVFHSTADALREHAADVPFTLVADPDKRLYAELGVEAGKRALFDPRAWPGIAKALGRALVEALRGKPVAPLDPAGGRWGLPADFLIAPDGRVRALKYGVHVDDHWSVDDLLALR